MTKETLDLGWEFCFNFNKLEGSIKWFECKIGDHFARHFPSLHSFTINRPSRVSFSEKVLLCEQKALSFTSRIRLDGGSKYKSACFQISF